MLNYLYIVRNLVNGKFYIGVHSTDDPDDGYMGSGKRLKLAMKKYGVESFEKILLYVFDDSELMYLAESMIVDDNFVKRNDVYNMATGGNGGFSYIINNGLHSSQYRIGIPAPKERVYKSKKTIQESYDSGKFDHIKELSRQRLIDNPIHNPLSVSLAQKGKPKSQEQKDKISKAMLGRKKPNYPKTRKIRNITTPYKPQKDLVCDVCGKVGKQGPLKRFHFEKCKFRPVSSDGRVLP